MDRKKKLKSFGMTILYGTTEARTEKQSNLDRASLLDIWEANCVGFRFYGSYEKLPPGTIFFSKDSNQFGPPISLFTIIFDPNADNGHSCFHSTEDSLNNFDAIATALTRYFAFDRNKAILRELKKLFNPEIAKHVKRWIKAAIDDVLESEIGELFSLAHVLRQSLRVQGKYNTGGLMATEKAIKAIESFFGALAILPSEDEIEDLPKPTPQNKSAGLFLRIPGSAKQDLARPQTLQAGDKMFWTSHSQAIGFSRNGETLHVDGRDDDKVPVEIKEPSEFYRMAQIIASTHGLKVKSLPSGSGWYFWVEFVSE